MHPAKSVILFTTTSGAGAGLLVYALMGAILPAGMSQERFDWLDRWCANPAEDVIKTVGTERMKVADGFFRGYIARDDLEVGQCLLQLFDAVHDARAVAVGGVDDDDLRIVADEPDVVVDFPTTTVEFEGAVGHDALNGAVVHNITTDRSTSPVCILWNASSIPSRPIRSETNLSRGSRPWR